MKLLIFLVSFSCFIFSGPAKAGSRFVVQATERLEDDLMKRYGKDIYFRARQSCWFMNTTHNSSKNEEENRIVEGGSNVYTLETARCKKYSISQIRRRFMKVEIKVTRKDGSTLATCKARPAVTESAYKKLAKKHKNLNAFDKHVFIIKDAAIAGVTAAAKAAINDALKDMKKFWKNPKHYFSLLKMLNGKLQFPMVRELGWIKNAHTIAKNTFMKPTGNLFLYVDSCTAPQDYLRHLDQSVISNEKDYDVLRACPKGTAAVNMCSSGAKADCPSSEKGKKSYRFVQCDTLDLADRDDGQRDIDPLLYPGSVPKEWQDKVEMDPIKSEREATLDIVSPHEWGFQGACDVPTPRFKAITSGVPMSYAVMTGFCSSGKKRDCRNPKFYDFFSQYLRAKHLAKTGLPERKIPSGNHISPVGPKIELNPISSYVRRMAEDKKFAKSELTKYEKIYPKRPYSMRCQRLPDGVWLTNCYWRKIHSHKEALFDDRTLFGDNKKLFIAGICTSGAKNSCPGEHKKKVSKSAKLCELAVAQDYEDYFESLDRD